MKKPADPEEAKLLSKLINGGRTNLTEWVESLCKEFCEDEATETYSSLQSIESQFFSDLHDNFFCLLPVLLHKFLIEKGVAHIVEPRPPLRRRPNTNWEERERAWKRFVQEREWEHFLRK
jgi:hypothetical protein